MARILALQGSPRVQGNTRAVLDFVLEGATAAGAVADVIDLIGLKHLSGCRECFACQGQDDAPGCAVDDDMQLVLRQTLASDVLVLATPVFCWSPSWVLKMALDRLYCMFKFGDDGQVRCLLEGQAVAGVITAGGGNNDGADLVEETCRRMARYSGARWLGAFVAPNLKGPVAVRGDHALAERARAFGRQIARA
ncbi:MAG TPA: flavodoxin family protein [Phycisphaerae bacterium]|nr:flavodoxin family protein [Phycisphaerae bacterium]HNU44502.1 flavodoxin family protein [Phycisphaerae bacterium]